METNIVYTSVKSGLIHVQLDGEDWTFNFSASLQDAQELRNLLTKALVEVDYEEIPH